MELKHRLHANVDRVNRLAALGIELPDDITAAIDHHAALRRRSAATTGERELHQKMVDALTADPAADLEHLLAQASALPARRKAIGAAVDQAMAAIGTVTEQHADTLTRAIRAGVYAEAMGKLQALAKIGSTETVESLVLAGRSDDAHLLAHASVYAQQAHAATAGRDSLYRGAHLAENPYRWWKNPSQAISLATSGTDDTLSYLLAALRAGATPWLATYSEIEAAQRKARTKPKGTPPEPQRPARTVRAAA